MTPSCSTSCIGQSGGDGITRCAPRLAVVKKHNDCFRNWCAACNEDLASWQPFIFFVLNFIYFEPFVAVLRYAETL